MPHHISLSHADEESDYQRLEAVKWLFGPEHDAVTLQLREGSAFKLVSQQNRT